MRRGVSTFLPYRFKPISFVPRGFNKHAGPFPKRLHQKTRAYQRSAAHGYHGPHNDLNPLCLSGTAASHAPLCACM